MRSQDLALRGGAGGLAFDSGLDRRALALWPRLHPTALRRCGHDPHRIAALVARRTSIPKEAILRLLTMPAVSDDDAATWFG
jgi:hypothetical protein